MWAIHGVLVDERIVLRPDSLTTSEILALSNAEQRHVAIERFGWDRFVEDAGLTLVDECPDPCNDPFTLRLFDLPEQLYDTPIRVLLCTNASPSTTGRDAASGSPSPPSSPARSRRPRGWAG